MRTAKQAKAPYGLLRRTLTYIGSMQASVCHPGGETPMAHKPRALAAPPAMRPPRRRAGPLFSATQSRLSGRQRGNLFAHLSDVLKLRPRQISRDDGALWRPAGTFSSARHAGNAERRGEPGNDRYVSDHAVDCPGANGFEIPVARTCRARSGLGRVDSVDAVRSVTILSGAATGQTS